MTPRTRSRLVPVSLLACAALLAAGSFAAGETKVEKPAQKPPTQKAATGQPKADAKRREAKKPAANAKSDAKKPDPKKAARPPGKSPEKPPKASTASLKKPAAVAKPAAGAKPATSAKPAASAKPGSQAKRASGRPVASKPIAGKLTVAKPAASGRLPMPRMRPVPLAATAAAPIGAVQTEPDAGLASGPGRFLAAAIPSFVSPAVGAATDAPAAAPSAPLSYAPTAAPTESDIDATKEAINLARRGKTGAATERRDQIRDSAAQKLVEWMILRSDDNGASFARYAAFVRANPTWPSIGMLRRRAEGQLWSEKREPGTVFAFFSNQEPSSTRGKLAMARAALAQGDRATAQRFVQDAWRNDDFSPEFEQQVLETFGGLLTRADHKARMDVRLYAEDNETAIRAAKRLGATELAVAQARVAVNRKASNAAALLQAVPSEARNDAGYLFSRIQWHRRNDRIGEAAQLMLSAPRDPEVILDANEWWVERRLVARKLLDEGNAQTAYRIARDAAMPVKSSLRVEPPFTAGWIALRFLNDPATARRHFAEIEKVNSHPTALARGAYWQGRAAEASGSTGEARRHYEAAAHYASTYYGQLARARLGHRDIAVRQPPALSGPQRASLRNTDVVRALELLYLTGNRDLVITFVADLDRVNDAGLLTVIGEVAAKHDDARAMLTIGKTGLARGHALDQYAFPSIGIPKFASIGPSSADRSLVYAIARQESAFNRLAVSSAKAMGLMQVMPGTGRIVARKNGVAFDAKKLLHDPVYNAQIGAAEIGSLVQDYDGCHVLAFAAYNAGRGRVKEWVARYGDPRNPNVDPVDWVERIPFTETRNYVQRVMENVQVYRARFGGGAKLAIETDMRGSRQ